MRITLMALLMVLCLNNVWAADKEITCGECCGGAVQMLCLPACSGGCLRLLTEIMCDTHAHQLPEGHVACLPENRIGYAKVSIYFGTALLCLYAGEKLGGVNARANAQTVCDELSSCGAAPFVFLTKSLRRQKME